MLSQMQIMTKRVFKLGKSNVVILPYRWLQSMGIKTGDFVYLRKDENDIITIEKELNKNIK